MNFGDILDEWDRETAKPRGKKKIIEDQRRERAAEKVDSSACQDEDDNKARARSAREDAEKRANPMDVWLRRYGTENKDALLDDSIESISPAEQRRRLRSMRPEAVIDLHGLTRDAAWARLESFFADSVRRGFKKVLIIHGKGVHSPDDPVLRQMVRLFLEQNSHAGESGASEKDSGGSGSTWVILK